MRNGYGVLAAAGVLAAVTAAAPALAVQSNAPRAASTPIETTVVAGGLQHPWGLAFLGDGRMAVTERPGRLRIVSADGALSEPVANVPRVAASGQGGLLDVAEAPDFAESGLIYLSYAEPRDGRRASTAVARGRLVQTGATYALENVERIFQQQPALSGGRHFGSRIVFNTDGTLWVTLGDRGHRDMSQDPANTVAKIVRLNPDGSIPQDNPFVGRDGYLPETFSIGHRNAQGAARHPETGELWTVEHGARGGDEINIARAGLNYGWPVISYGRHYSGRQIGEGTTRQGLEQPLYFWDPSIAPSGLAFYRGELFSGWNGSVLVGALRDQMLVRLEIADGTVVAREHLLEDMNQRIRDVEVGPDGAVYVLTDDFEGALVRITPANG